MDKGKTPMRESPNPTIQLMINCIIWNARGANNLDLKKHCKSIVDIDKLAILALLETRMPDHKGIAEYLGFSNNI